VRSRSYAYDWLVIGINAHTLTGATCHWAVPMFPATIKLKACSLKTNICKWKIKNTLLIVGLFSYK
jgi:hypothetical protein